MVTQAVTKVRQVTTISRVHHLFRWVSGESAASTGAGKVYPDRTDVSVHARPQGLPFVTNHSVDSKTPCGRARLRHRRLHRRCFSLRPSHGLKLCTMNLQGFFWSKLSHRPKLQQLIGVLRKHDVDMAFLSDLHFFPPEALQVVWIEEFCFVLRGRVGFALRASVAMASEQSGRPFLHVNSDRLLSLGFSIHGEYVHFTANYTPAGQSASEKRQHYQEAQKLHLQCLDVSSFQIWSGDFNGHVAAGEAEPEVLGSHGLTSPSTTAGGRILKEFLRGTQLCHVDSFHDCNARGTWKHNLTHEFYELDVFLISRSHAHLVGTHMGTFPGVSDHLAKTCFVHVGNLVKRQQRMARRRLWQRRNFQRTTLQPQLNMAAFRGPSASAVACRQQYSALVDKLLDNFDVSPAPDAPEQRAFDGVLEGWEESHPRVWHAYPDGSGQLAEIAHGQVVTPATAGWGAAVWTRDKVFEACCPVSLQSSQRDFRGAERATNNTAEASAMLFLFEWCLRNIEHFDVVHVHYDSEYAMNVSLGRWRVTRNTVLAKRLKATLQKLQALRCVKWTWIKGHTGNQGNERADKLANDGRLGCYTPFQDLASSAPRRRLVGKQPLVPVPELPQVPEPDVTWTDLANTLVVAAESTFGRTVHRGLWSPYTKDDLRSLDMHDQAVMRAFDNVRLSLDMVSRAASNELFRKAKRARAVFKAGCRKRWMEQVLEVLHSSLDCHDVSLFYRTLKQIGISVSDYSREGLQSFSLDALRTQAQKSAGTVDPVNPDLIASVVPEYPTAHHLGVPPNDQEISEALCTLRESSPGLDEVTVHMLKFAGSRARWQLRLLLHQMWSTDPTTWDKLAMEGVAVALYKGTGDRSDLDNHRFVVLLSAVSRVLARILATRISQWAEQRGFFPEEQFGFRKHRSTQDCLFAARLLVEMASEVPMGVTHPLEQLLVLVFVDITKAYTRVQRSSAWLVFSRLGMPDNVIRLLQGLHDMTTYRCRARQGLSDTYQQLTGFREGCCTSPVLYNLYHTWPLRDFNKRRHESLQLQCIHDKPFNLRMHKQQRKGDCVLTKQLSLLSFADDTTLLARGNNYQELEDLLCATLADWKETIKPQKTKRLMVGVAGRSTDRPCVEAAKLLGSWLQDNAGYATEDCKRLEAARAIWRSLYKQFPRFSLTAKQKGRVVHATVIRNLLYSTESRVVSAVTIRKWQVFLNAIARGLTGRRLRDMEGSMTMADVRREANLDSIHVYIGVGQLRYLGHVARLPAARLERALLFRWLPSESGLPASKQAPSTRRHFWQLLKSAMEASGVANWEHEWVRIAGEDGGAVWSTIVATWRKKQRDLETQQTWVEKHSAAATTARRETAEQRVFDSIGARPTGTGKYICPHCCDPPVTMYLKSLRKHVELCKLLSSAVRARQAAQRQRALDHAIAAPAAPVVPTEVAPVPVAAAAEPHDAPAVPAAKPKARKSRRNDDWDPQKVREAYQQRFPHRQMSLTDLPAPQPPSHLDNQTCLFCLVKFPSTAKCCHHSLACPKMPYKEWLRRVRVCQHDFRESNYKCPHCYIGFATPKAAGRHSVTCGKRRTVEGFSLHTHEFHDL